MLNLFSILYFYVKIAWVLGENPELGTSLRGESLRQDRISAFRVEDDYCRLSSKEGIMG